MDAGMTAHRNLTVVGAQWGDEGKGKIVHYLAEFAEVIVRYQGGNNAGHTVIYKGKTLALHLIPSGVLFPRRQAVLGHGMVIDPKGFYEEIRTLKERGISVQGRLHVSLGAHVVLPYHVLLDHRQEETGLPIGTTRRGIGPCYSDKVGRCGIQVADYLDRERFVPLLEQNLRQKKMANLKKQILGDYPRLAGFLRPFAADTVSWLDRALRQKKKVLFEGAQGVMLDVDCGTYPFVTSSNTAAGGVCTGAGVGPKAVGGVLGVAKAYTTRVGTGPFPSEMEKFLAGFLREKGREYGATTGRPRRIGWLDLVQLKRAVQVSGIDSLALTKMDTLSGIHPIKVCTAYRHGGKTLKDFPVSRRLQAEVEPVYEILPGFEGDLSGVRRYRDLPPGARAYISFIERRLGIGVSIVSVGQGREATIVRSRVI